ncbi:MAG: hypothetical protein AB7Y74_15210 [Syntrophorhabdus sp.]|jgi:hypothetical protein
MIKRKGVCDICAKEFELNEGSFAIRIIEDKLDRYSKKWMVTIVGCVKDAPDEGFSHVCGKTCLYRALDKVMGKKTEENRLSVIVDNTDDSNKGPVAM